MFDANLGSDFRNQFIDQCFLHILGAADIDADYGDVAVVAHQSGQQTGMGAGAATGADHPINANPFFERLLKKFLGACDIAQGTDFVGGAAGDDIGYRAIRGTRGRRRPAWRPSYPNRPVPR